MEMTKDNNEIFIKLWNENKPKGFVHPMRKGVADIIFDALELAEYTVNFENDVFSLYDNQTNEDLGNKSLKYIFDKAYSICDIGYPDDTISRTFGFNILSIFENEELSPIEYKKEIRETLYKFYQTEKYFNVDEFLFNSIDYTTKNCVEIDNTYYEFEKTQNMLSIGNSIVDLENEYGENNFPEEAIADGKIIFFDNESDCINYLCEKHNLKDFEEVYEILLSDFDYKTVEVLKTYIPKLNDEQIELLANIIEDQEINLEYIHPLTFNNIYYEFDKAKLSENQLEELTSIKEELSKSTLENIVEEITDFIELFKSNGINISEEDKKDFENFISYHMEINTQSFFKRNENIYFVDRDVGIEKIVDKEFLLGRLEMYIQNCDDSNDEDLQVHKNLFSKYIKKSTIKIIYTKDSYGYESWTDYDEKGNEIHFKDSNGDEKWREYDENGKGIHFKNSNGFENWTDYDDKGNVIHSKNSNGFENWTDYDDKGNVIHSKNSNGFENWTDYDDKGNVIHSKDNEGYEQWTDYDDKGNVIHSKDNEGYEQWTDYDDKGNVIHSKDNEGYEQWTDYDEKDNQIHYKNSDGFETWTKYNDKGNIIHFKNSTGYEKWTEYDDKGNVIHFKNSTGYKKWTEYDDKGNVIHSKDSDGYERWYEYDEKNNEIHYKDSADVERWYEYDDKGNEIHSKDSDGFEKWTSVEYISKEQYMQEQKDLTQEEQEVQMYKKIHIRDSDGFEKWTEYDDKGNEIHYKNSTGFETWKEYDDKGNEIHYKDSDGIEEWKEYDDKGKLIHSKDSDGFEEWTEYDEKGNIIHFKDSTGLEEWKKYDEKENEIHFKDSEGFEEWKEYDDKGNKIYYKNSTGWEEWTEYDDKSNEIHYKDSDGYEHWKEYDEKGNEIHFKNSHGYEHWKEYDEKGNVIHSKNSDGIERWYEYDDKGNVIHFKHSDGWEEWKEYDEKGNEIHFKNSNGFETWQEYDDKGNEIHYKNSNGDEQWTEYDDKDNVIHFKTSDGFERSSTVEYISKEQYIQEQTISIQEEQESQMYKKIHFKNSNGFETWQEYDDNGKEIHFKNSNGFETWQEYDDKGNIIHYKNSNGFESWTDYDEKGNLIHLKNSNGDEYWRDYDEKGNEIHLKDSNGLEQWKEYDDKGNEIHYKNSDGLEQWKEYDDKGNEIHYKDSDGDEYWKEYDDKGNEIHYKESDGVEYWIEYDDKGNEIYYKNSDGFEKWYEYDDKGNEIHHKNSDGYEQWREYDEKGNEIHHKDSNGYELWREYDEKGNEIHLKDSKGYERWSTVEYLAKEQYIQEKTNDKTLTFGQLSDSGELKLIKEAYFKELVIDENDASKNKVVLGFKENDQEQLLEMGESEYNKLLDAFNILEEQQNKAWEIQKYSQIAEKEPQKIFEEIKYSSFWFWEEDNKLTGYLKGLSKNNNIHHYLDELLFESCRDSNENLFCKVVDTGANISCRREEKGEPINILHYALHYTNDEKLSIYIKKIIEKTRTLTTEDNVELYLEQDFEGRTPFEVSLDKFDGKNYNPQSLILDAMIDEGISSVKDLLFVDRVGTKVLYSQNDDGSMQILCFDNDNNILNSDFDTVSNENTYGECLFEDLSFQLSKNGHLYNAQLNNNKKLIAELKEIPQKLWDDSINYRMLSEIAKLFTGQDFYDFDSILELEKLKNQIFNNFDNRKELILQGKLESSQFIKYFSRELILDGTKDCELIQFLQNDNKATESFKTELVAKCFEKKLTDLFNEISPRPGYCIGMLKNNDCEAFYHLINNSGNFNKRLNEDEAEIILKYIQYEDYNFYKSVDGELCMLDVSEDFTGEGKKMSPKDVVDFAYEMMVKARDYEYACYDIKDEEVICNLRKQFSPHITESVSDSKSTVQEFFSKLKDSLYENAPLDVILKSAGTVLQSFSETEKKEISLYLQNKGASSEDKVGKILSEILSPEKQRKKRSDDFSPSL